MVNELQTLNAKIAEKIGAELIDLIPSDQWQALVDAEVIKFKRETAPRIIKELLSEEYKTKAKQTITEFCNTNEWNEVTQTYTNAALSKFLADSGGVIFAGVLNPSMQIVIQNLQNQLGY